MDLPALRAVVTVADTLHFGRAAQRLEIAQPQVSQRVRRLETELGFRVFERDNHRVLLTPAGELVIRHAREVLAAADRLTYVAEGVADGTAGVVRIGAVGSALFGSLSHLLAPVRQRLPEVDLQVREMETPEQLEALSNGTLDLGFLRPPVPSGFRGHIAWSEPLVAALPEKHPLARSTRLRGEDLSGQRVVLFPREAGPGYWDQAAAAVAGTGALLEEAQSADHITTLLGMVALGAGLTLVPASMQVLRLPGIDYRPLSPTAPMHLAVAMRVGQPTPAAERVLAAIPPVADRRRRGRVS